jgi:hypothetical protein
MPDIIAKIAGLAHMRIPAAHINGGHAGAHIQLECLGDGHQGGGKRVVRGVFHAGFIGAQGLVGVRPNAARDHFGQIEQLAHGGLYCAM